jgi:hypothetical protein
MAEGEELRTDYDPTIRPILTFRLPAAVDAMENRCARSGYAYYDEARIGFAGSEDSSPTAIRERTSLIVSVVFFAAI